MVAYIDTLPEAVSSIAPDKMVAEMRSLVFARLSEVGDKGAVAKQAVTVPNAWRRVLAEVLEGQPSVCTVT